MAIDSATARQDMERREKTREDETRLDGESRARKRKRFGHTGARTQDHSVISTALYRLSYTTAHTHTSHTRKHKHNTHSTCQKPLHNKHSNTQHNTNHPLCSHTTQHDNSPPPQQQTTPTHITQIKHTTHSKYQASHNEHQTSNTQHNTSHTSNQIKASNHIREQGEKPTSQHKQRQRQRQRTTVRARPSSSTRNMQREEK